MTKYLLQSKNNAELYFSKTNKELEISKMDLKEYNEEDEGRRLFFHFGWMDKNLKQVKPLSLVIYLDDAEDYSSGSGEFFYDFYDDEWDVIFKYLVNDLRAE